MAAPRKSAQQLAAREKARAKARELTERHEKLIDLASEFFEHQERADQLRAEATAKAEAILAKGERDARGAVRDAAEKVRDMLATGESRAAVASRLGLSSAELKRHTEMGSDQEPVAPSAQDQEAPAAAADSEQAA